MARQSVSRLNIYQNIYTPSTVCAYIPNRRLPNKYKVHCVCVCVWGGGGGGGGCWSVHFPWGPSTASWGNSDCDVKKEIQNSINIYPLIWPHGRGSRHFPTQLFAPDDTFINYANHMTRLWQAGDTANFPTIYGPYHGLIKDGDHATSTR